MTQQYGVILFHTTSSVLRAEKLLIKEGDAVKLIPTPRQFSSDCGIALRFDWSCRERIKAAIEEARVEFDAIHFLDARPV
jgi:hypothetical protein